MNRKISPVPSEMMVAVNSREMVAIKTYAALREILGYPAVTLEPGTYLLQCQKYIASALKDWNQPIPVGDTVLEFGDGMRSSIKSTVSRKYSAWGFWVLIIRSKQAFCS